MESTRQPGGGLVLITRQNNKRMFSVSSSPREGGGGGGGKKKIKTFSNNNHHNHRWRPWGELFEDLLYLILNRLNLVDYSNFGAVCRRWRSLAVGYKQDYLASQPPLILMVTKVAKRSCHFYNIFDDGDTTFKTMLPYPDRIFYLHVLRGYLLGFVMCSRQLWLLNPISRHVYRFLLPPYAIHRVVIAFSSIREQGQGRSLPSSPDDLVIVGVAKLNSYIQFYQFGEAKWTVRPHGGECGEIVDLATFKGKIYFLTRSAGIGTIKLTTSRDDPILVPLEVNKGSPPPPTASLNGYYLELVSSDEQLLMVVFLRFKFVSVFKLDFLKMEWCRVEESLGDNQALFISNLKSLNQSSTLVKNPARWGGRSNCIYHFDLEGNCSVYSLDGTVLQSFPAALKKPLMVEPLWYFPHQSYSSFDYLYEEEPAS